MDIFFKFMDLLPSTLPKILLWHNITHCFHYLFYKAWEFPNVPNLWRHRLSIIISVSCPSWLQILSLVPNPIRDKGEMYGCLLLKWSCSSLTTKNSVSCPWLLLVSYIYHLWDRTLLIPTFSKVFSWPCFLLWLKCSKWSHQFSSIPLTSAPKFVWTYMEI